jgi:hypothetical protein
MSNPKDEPLMEGKITDSLTVRILTAYIKALRDRDPEAVDIRELLPSIYEAVSEIIPLRDTVISALEHKAERLSPKERLQTIKLLIGWRDNA